MTICESCDVQQLSNYINSLLAYSSKGRYFLFKYLVQNFRTSDYRLGGFFWKHEPDRFRMKSWLADNNLHIPDTSGSDRVDWW